MAAGWRLRRSDLKVFSRRLIRCSRIPHSISFYSLWWSIYNLKVLCRSSVLIIGLSLVGFWGNRRAHWKYLDHRWLMLTRTLRWWYQVYICCIFTHSRCAYALVKSVWLRRGNASWFFLSRIIKTTFVVILYFSKASPEDSSAWRFISEGMLWRHTSEKDYARSMSLSMC